MGYFNRVTHLLQRERSLNKLHYDFSIRCLYLFPDDLPFGEIEIMQAHVHIYNRINYAKQRGLDSTVTMSIMSFEDFAGIPLTNEDWLRLELG